MRILLGFLALVMAAIAAKPAAAHPHVFVDTTIEVDIDDQGRAAGIWINWHYDDLFSLVIIGDRGLDPDFDGVLTAEELAGLQGWDMQWDPGYPGDTYALQGGAALVLSGPSEWSAAYADARISTRHYRAFSAPVVIGAEPLVVQVYDPSFYTAYAITEAVVIRGGPNCTAVNYEPDRDAADQILQDAMAEQAGSADVEMAFPAVGAAYAEEARITCEAAS
jgi:ABC-type uncharacterized transport system substrate-binding protein